MSSVQVNSEGDYNRLPLGRLAEFEGVGVYYAATQLTAAGVPQQRPAGYDDDRQVADRHIQLIEHRLGHR